MNDARVLGDTGIVTSYFGDAAAGVAKFVRNNQVSYFSVGFTLGGAKYEGNLTLGCTTPFSGGTPSARITSRRQRGLFGKGSAWQRA